MPASKSMYICIYIRIHIYVLHSETRLAALREGYTTHWHHTHDNCLLFIFEEEKRVFSSGPSSAQWHPGRRTKVEA